MIPGETIATGASPKCACGTIFKNEVLSSNAGYYIGTFCHTNDCDDMGPYSRESGYYKTRELAEKALAKGNFSR